MSDKLAAAAGDDYHDNSYTTSGNTTKDEPVQVVRDEDYEEIDSSKADTDAQLERDDMEAIDKSNIIKGDGNKTRSKHSHPGLYTEPGDEEGLPSGEDGTSSVR